MNVVRSYELSQLQIFPQKLIDIIILFYFIRRPLDEIFEVDYSSVVSWPGKSPTAVQAICEAEDHELSSTSKLYLQTR